jgi:hypothetical protein
MIAMGSSRAKIGFDGCRAPDRCAVVFCPLLEMVGCSLLGFLFLLKHSARFKEVTFENPPDQKV